MNQNVLIRNSKLKIANGNHSTLNILAKASGKADYNTQHCRRLQFTIDQLSIACVAANNSTLNILALASGKANHKTQNS